MTAELNYTHLISKVDERFPQFKAYLAEQEIRIGDNVGMYFTFLSIFLKEHWMDANLQRELAVLLQHMQAAGDEATQITVHDFLLDICSSCKEHGLNLNLLMQNLPAALQNRLSEIDSYWQTAACELPRGCC